MAENKDGMEKSEQASAKRLEEARKKGQVASTRELAPVMVFFGAMGMMALGGPAVWRQVHQQSRFWFESAGWLELTPESLYTMLLTTVQEGLFPIVLFALGLGVLGIGATVVQTGFLWIEDGLQPKWSKLNPLSGLKRILSLRGLVEFLKTLFKLGLVTLVAYVVVRQDVVTIIQLSGLELMESIPQVWRMAFRLVLWISLVFLVLAVMDFGFQKWQFLRDQRMTKQEVKDEAKDVEGNPLIRSRRLSLQRDRARQRMMQNVPTADVVITNPTHLAVALKYDPAQSDAPTVVAKGAGFLAEQIRQIARKSGVPMVENKSLARSLFKAVAVGKAIPTDLYRAVAEILAYVYRLKHPPNGTAT